MKIENSRCLKTKVKIKRSKEQKIKTSLISKLGYKGIIYVNYL
jgi:hypothetical protein